MDRAELRSLQEPLKDRYREDPDAALVTLSATSTLAEGITCSVRTGKAIAAAGLHPASGGDGSTLCSGDMLLEALAACAGVTLRAVATSLEIEIAQGFVHATATWTSAAPSASTATCRLGSSRSTYASTWRPTSRTSSSTPCSRSPCATASSIRRSPRLPGSRRRGTGCPPEPHELARLLSPAAVGF